MAVNIGKLPTDYSDNTNACLALSTSPVVAVGENQWTAAGDVRRRLPQRQALA
jgi:hypothetical protein